MSAALASAAWRWQDEDLLLQLYVQPGARRNQWAGLHGDALKLAITAPPVDGKANAFLQSLLAGQFAVSKQQVRLEKGELSRHKTLRICQPRQLPADLQALGLTWAYLPG